MSTLRAHITLIANDISYALQFFGVEVIEVQGYYSAGAVPSIVLEVVPNTSGYNVICATGYVLAEELALQLNGALGRALESP